MIPAQLEERIKQLGPDTQVKVVDLTGTEDHYQVEVKSSVFANLSMLERHKKVYDLVRAEVNSGEIHALSLSTQTL
jgi:stress-induced morphogen